jgi:hypothetical protein
MLGMILTTNTNSFPNHQPAGLRDGNAVHTVISELNYFRYSSEIPASEG